MFGGQFVNEARRRRASRDAAVQPRSVAVIRTRGESELGDGFVRRGGALGADDE
jgi:hypothetical protein